MSAAPSSRLIRLTISLCLISAVATAWSGYQTARWDGRGEDGRELAGGIYYYRLSAGRETLARKMLLIR